MAGANPKGERCILVHDYEVTYILNPNLGDEDVTATTTRVSSLITTAGGEVTELKPWGGKRRLAYPIEHHRDGYYVTTKFRTTPGAAFGLDGQLRINDNIIRHLVFRMDDQG